jgi:branched-chain amino acid transport system permease protein
MSAGIRPQLSDELLIALFDQWLLGGGVGFLSVQNILDGLTVGMVYVLLAAGLSVIFGVMHVINFAHGELFALGAYFAIVVSAPFGDSTGFYVALFVAPLLVGVVGVALERYTVQPLYDRNPLYHILLTFGLVLVINDLIFLIWGTGPRIIERPDAITGTFDLLGASYSRYALFILVFGGTLTVAVWWLLTKTRYGLIIRAGAQDRGMVRNLGISIDRYYSLVFGVGAALAAVAGIIIAGRSQVTPTMGFNIIIAAFVIVVLGGLGSFRGAVVGGLGVGILQESLLRPFVPQLEGMVIFVLMIGVLLVRPRGLFGTEFEEEGGKLLTGTSGGLLSKQRRFRLGLAALGALAILPLLAGRLVPSFYVEFLVVRIIIWGLFALALDFVMGYTGLVSLGHALFWGLGAYVSGTILFNFTESAIVAAGVAVLVGATVAWIVGYLSIRVHGVYFAMITLAFAELFHTSLTRIDGWAVGICETVPGCNPQTVADIQFTGGSEGLFGFSSYYGIGGVGVRLDEIGVFIGPITLTDQLLFYYIALGVLIGSFFITRQILRSPFGAVLKGIRENEQRVRFLGYNPTVYKRRAFTISGTFATLAGVLFALDTGFVSPGAAEWLKSGEVIVMVILGGMGTLFGPIIGSFTFFGLEELIQEGMLVAPIEWLFSLVGMGGVVPDISDRWRLVLGTTFVLFVIFLPRGIVSIPEKLQSVTRRARDRGGPANQDVTGGDD